MQPAYHVMPLAAGRWQVQQEGGASTIYERKDAAITAAVELARAGAPAVVKVHAPDGSVESERVVRDRS